MDLTKRYSAVLDALPDHVFIFSESGIYIDVYGGDDNATGFDCKAFIGRSLYEVSPADKAKQFHQYILTALDSQKTQAAYYKFDNQSMIDLPPGSEAPQEIWFEGVIKPLKLIENGERTVSWVARNITQRHLLEQRLKQLSEIDDLTGIANRRSFTKALSSALKEFHSSGRRFIVLMLDIDHFKRINDTFGHSYGDQVLKFVVNQLNSRLRKSDYFARIGGEEFAIILNETGVKNAANIAEKLRGTLAKSIFTAEESNTKITISIGFSEVNETDTDVKTILSRADTAMYHSKHNGRNRVTHYPDTIEHKI